MKKDFSMKASKTNLQQFNFQAFGVKVGINSETIDYLLEIRKRLDKILPNGFEQLNEELTNHNFIIKKSIYGDFQLFKDDLNIANSSELDEFYDFVESAIRLTIAEYAVSRVFLHAGVVCWKGKAIIIPGSSFSGKTSLVAALIKKGALYYSDEYAVLDEAGQVHPFPKMLSLRGIIDDFRQVDRSAESIGGKTATIPAEVGMILLTQFDKDYQLNENRVKDFKPEILSQGQGLLEIINQAIPIRNNPKFVLQVLNKVASRAIIAKSKRGEAQEFAGMLLDYFEHKVLKQTQFGI